MYARVLRILLIVADGSEQDIARCLVGRGFDVETAADGRDGLDRFAARPADLVLLDLRLRDIGGLEVLRAVRTQCPEAVVMVCSDQATVDDVAEAFRLGAVDYVATPKIGVAVVADKVRLAVERVRHAREQEMQLNSARREVEAKNVALHEVLTSIDAERRRVGQQVHQNVERVILPQLRSLNDGLNRQQQRAIEQIAQGLEDIVSPFVDKVSRDVASLSATELRVCALVKRGLAVKEIAELEHLSPETVAAHRRSIRRKLGIAHTKINLTTYLQTAFHATGAAATTRRFREQPTGPREQVA